MSDVVIRAEGLGKKYIIGHASQRERYTALRDVIARGAQNAFRKARDMVQGRPIIEGDELEEVWALRDISFEIKRGEIVGIIGRNGAGKSTLLKILSRITDPSEGRVSIRGRVASLLEVGTGFHPELSGRENIFLNGAILGMSRTETKRKFDEIVAFAEVSKFIDTPVKRYSSGMYVRLAFSVAAHLEPDILLVDEVLAVGDIEFQKKCTGKIDDISKQGRTVIFVSHNMPTISNLCQKGMILSAGGLIFQGSASEAIVKYYQGVTKSASADDSDQSGRRCESETVRLLGVELLGVKSAFEITIHDAFTIRMTYRIKRPIEGKCVPHFHFFTADGSEAFASGAANVEVLPPGDYHADCEIPGGLLNEGAYFIGVALTTFYTGGFEQEFYERDELTLNVIDPMDERSTRYGYVGPVPGVVRPRLDWSVGNANH